MRFTPQQIEERKKILPEDIRVALSSMDTGDKIEAISTRHKLHIDQMGEVSRHTAYLMLGLLKPSQFIPELTTALHIPQKEAVEIAKEVNEQIFKPIRESLKKIHQLNDAGMGEVETPNQTIKPAKTGDFDDRLGKYLSSTPIEQNKPSSIPPYTQDPYREAIN